MIDVFTFTEAGRHEVNQDSFVVEAHSEDPTMFVVVLADGKSGSPGAAQASSLACRTALAHALSHSPRRLRKRKAWLRILAATDSSVHSDPSAGITTLVGACVYSGGIVGASSGDSAAFLVVPAGHHELTRGQTKNPPVGSGAARLVPFDAPLRPPWQVYFLTDGVWDHHGRAQLLADLRFGAGAASLERLASSGRPPGGNYRDDFTALILQGGVAPGPSG